MVPGIIPGHRQRQRVIQTDAVQNLAIFNVNGGTAWTPNIGNPQTDRLVIVCVAAIGNGPANWRNVTMSIGGTAAVICHDSSLNGIENIMFGYVYLPAGTTAAVVSVTGVAGGSPTQGCAVCYVIEGMRPGIGHLDSGHAVSTTGTSLVAPAVPNFKNGDFLLYFAAHRFNPIASWSSAVQQGTPQASTSGVNLAWAIKKYTADIASHVETATSTPTSGQWAIGWVRFENVY